MHFPLIPSCLYKIACPRPGSGVHEKCGSGLENGWLALSLRCVLSIASNCSVRQQPARFPLRQFLVFYCNISALLVPKRRYYFHISLISPERGVVIYGICVTAHGSFTGKRSSGQVTKSLTFLDLFFAFTMFLNM